MSHGHTEPPEPLAQAMAQHPNLIVERGLLFCSECNSAIIAEITMIETATIRVTENGLVESKPELDDSWTHYECDCSVETVGGKKRYSLKVENYS